MGVNSGEQQGVSFAKRSRQGAGRLRGVDDGGAGLGDGLLAALGAAREACDLVDGGAQGGLGLPVGDLVALEGRS